MRRSFGELLPHLVEILLVALLDLLPEDLLERSIPDRLVTLLRLVGDHVGDERAREPLGLLVGIVREEGIDRRTTGRRRRSRRTGRRTRGGRRRSTRRG